MFEFIKNLFNKKVDDKKAKFLYDELSNKFFSYINSDVNNSKKFWDTVTFEELDIVKYEYIKYELFKYLISNDMQSTYDNFLKFFKSYQNPEYKLFLSDFNIYGKGSLIEVCAESRNINYLFENIEKFRITCTKYSNEDLEYNYWKSIKNKETDPYDSQIINYLYLKFKYDEAKTNNVLEKG
jgi:hypothetical protein